MRSGHGCQLGYREENDRTASIIQVLTELGRQKEFEVAKYHTARVEAGCHMATSDKPATKKGKKRSQAGLISSTNQFIQAMMLILGT